MSNVENVEVGMSDNADQRGPAKCELLCFVREKCSIMATDHLVKICSDFYREEEVSASRPLHVYLQVTSYKLYPCHTRQLRLIL